MKPILFSLCLLCSFFTFGQTDTLFVDALGKSCPRSQASFYRLLSGYAPELYVREYFLNHKTHMVAECESYDPFVRDGNYIVYNDKGQRMERGQFVNGKAAGVWTWWNADGSDSIIADHRNGSTPFILNKGGFTEFNYKPVYFVKEGKGQQSVVFLTGLGEAQYNFFGIYSKLKDKATVFAYDRPGLGNSQVVTTPRRIDSLAHELSALLVQQQVRKPYILVTHREGSLLARQFAAEHPGEVKGIVLIDPVYEGLYAELVAQKSPGEYGPLRERFRAPSENESGYGHRAEALHYFDFDAAGLSTNGRLVKDLNYPKDARIRIILSGNAGSGSSGSEEKEITRRYFQRLKEEHPDCKLLETGEADEKLLLSASDKVVAEVRELLK